MIEIKDINNIAAHSELESRLALEFERSIENCEFASMSARLPAFYTDHVISVIVESFGWSDDSQSNECTDALIEPTSGIHVVRPHEETKLVSVHMLETVKSFVEHTVEVHGISQSDCIRLVMDNAVIHSGLFNKVDQKIAKADKKAILDAMYAHEKRIACADRDAAIEMFRVCKPYLKEHEISHAEQMLKRADDKYNAQYSN